MRNSKLQDFGQRIAHAGNSGLAKVAVQWLIEHLCFVSSSVLADSLVLRNRHLRQAAKRYALCLEKAAIVLHNKANKESLT